MNPNTPSDSRSLRSGIQRPLSHVPQPPDLLEPRSALLTNRSRSPVLGGGSPSTRQHSFQDTASSHTAQSVHDHAQNDDDEEDNADDEVSVPGSDILYGNIHLDHDYDHGRGYDSTATDDDTTIQPAKPRLFPQGNINDELRGLGSTFEPKIQVITDVSDGETDILRCNDSARSTRHGLLQPAEISIRTYIEPEDTGESDITDGWASGDAHSSPSRSPSSRSSRSGDVKPLQKRLMGARELEPESNDRFFPRNSFASLITRGVVEEELRSITAPATSEYGNIPSIASQVCPTPFPGKFLNSKPRGLRRIFAILVVLQRTADIVNFLEAEIDDSDLPLEKIKRRGNEASDDLCSRRKPDEPIKFITSEWDEVVIDNFFDWQWRMVSPYFAQRKARNKVWHYKLRPKTTLPYIKRKTGSKRYDGGNAQVTRVYIHAKHHDFHRRPNFTGSFALKKLNTRSRDLFDQEVSMLRKFSKDQQPHLISLLATYEQNDSFYLLFDWAQCNLQEYWAKVHPNPDPNDKATVSWFMKQCKGIAYGILALHAYKTLSLDVNGKEKKTVFGHHGDIKEVNILWFPDTSDKEPKPNSGILKLADFGVAGFSTSQTASMNGKSNFRATPSYRAPESDLNEPTAQGRSYDMWTLGILYLQFVTWMLGGSTLLEKFGHARLSVDPGWYNLPTDTFFEIDKRKDHVHGNENRYVIKKAVTDFFKELHQHPKCTQFMHDMLDMVEGELLIVKSFDPNQRDRIAAEQLVGRFNEMENDRLANEDYGLKPVRRNS